MRAQTSFNGGGEVSGGQFTTTTLLIALIFLICDEKYSMKMPYAKTCYNQGMNEMLKVVPEDHESEHRLSSKVVTPFGGVYVDGNLSYVSTYDGHGIVPVPEEVGNTIGLALSVQDKVFSGRYPNLERKLAMLNCRKAVFVAGERMTAHEAADVESTDINAEELLLADVERIQNEGFGPHLITESYHDEIEMYLDEYDGTFPCAVHIFEFDRNSKTATMIETSVQQSGKISPDVVSQKMHKIHSFLVLGEDESGYICFQKMGPQIDEPFMVAGFEHMMSSYPLTEGREGVVFIGPM
jgi:hypothetical protein